MTGYVYKFLDKEKKEIYIGSTGDIRTRLMLHFPTTDRAENYRGCVPQEGIDEVEEILYTETKTFANARILEAYLIAKLKPKYNNDFNEEDELTYTLKTGNIEWKTYRYFKDCNPRHSIMIWDENELIYEVPYMAEIYEPLMNKLNIKMDIRRIGYATPRYENGYKVMRMVAKRRIHSGAERQLSKYEFMGYSSVKQYNENQDDTVA